MPKLCITDEELEVMCNDEMLDTYPPFSKYPDMFRKAVVKALFHLDYSALADDDIHDIIAYYNECIEDIMDELGIEDEECQAYGKVLLEQYLALIYLTKVSHT